MEYYNTNGSKLISVSPPIDTIDTTNNSIQNVLIDPEKEEVIWDYAYQDGKKIAIGYQIQYKFQFECRDRLKTNTCAS